MTTWKDVLKYDQYSRRLFVGWDIAWTEQMKIQTHTLTLLFCTLISEEKILSDFGEKVLYLIIQTTISYLHFYFIYPLHLFN